MNDLAVGQSYTFAVVALNQVGASMPTSSPPMALNPDRAPDSGNWYSAPVTFSATSTAPNSTCDTPTTYSGPDPPSVSLSLSCADDNGDSTTTDSPTFGYDNSPPVLTIADGPVDGAVYAAGTVPPAPTCIASDTTSGLTAEGCTISGYGTGVGAQNLTLTATDLAGNTTTQTRSYTVAQAAQVISVAAPPAAVYGGSATLTATGGGSGNPVTYTLAPTSGTGVCTVSGTNAATVSYTGTGSCVLTASQSGDTNYTAATTTVTIPVNPAGLTVTASSATYTYGDPATATTVTPAYSGFVAGDDVNVLTTAATCSADTTLGAGLHPGATTCTGATADNYTFTYLPGTLSVLKATLTAAAHSASRLYGATARPRSSTALSSSGKKPPSPVNARPPPSTSDSNPSIISSDNHRRRNTRAAGSTDSLGPTDATGVGPLVKVMRNSILLTRTSLPVRGSRAFPHTQTI